MEHVGKTVKKIMDNLKNICVICGITNLDGAPDEGIPYPTVEKREDCGNEILCDDCYKENKEEYQDEKVTD